MIQETSQNSHYLRSSKLFYKNNFLNKLSRSMVGNNQMSKEKKNSRNSLDEISLAEGMTERRPRRRSLRENRRNPQRLLLPASSATSQKLMPSLERGRIMVRIYFSFFQKTNEIFFSLRDFLYVSNRMKCRKIFLTRKISGLVKIKICDFLDSTYLKY